MTLFDHARSYHFDELKSHVTNSGNLDICDSDGCSLLYHFIDGYFCSGIDISESEKIICASHNDFDYDFWDSYVSEQQRTPLEQRKSGIRAQLDFLFFHGADPNLCIWIDDMRKTPLMTAVCNQDYYLTEYLLEHGADPGLWLFKPDGCNDKCPEKEYWLIDEMDMAIMNGSKGEQAKFILSIAHLLWKHGLNGAWDGYCIDIDPKQGVIGGHSLRTLY